MTSFILFLVGAFYSEAMALKAGSIVLLIDLSYKIKVPVICMKLFLSPFESGGKLAMALAYCIFAS